MTRAAPPVLIIEPEAAADAAAVEAVVLDAFGPGRFAKTAERLREGSVPIAGFVAREGGRLIGSVRLWSVAVGNRRAAFLGPIAVDAAFRETGVGARLVEDETEKRQALHALVEHTAPGRAKECIEVTDAEARSTLVLAIDVQEAACKARQGHPVDEAEHVARQEHFAGTVPLKLTARAVVRDAQLERPLPIPPSIRACQARHGARVPVELIREETLYSSDASRLDWAWVHECLSQHSYWAAGVTLKDLTVSLDNSIVFGAYRDARQVAFARVLTDQSRIAYLADVFVDARYRGRGYGKGIVDFALEHPCVASCDRVLLGTRDAVELYTRCGFAVASNTSMVRVRM